MTDHEATAATPKISQKAEIAQLRAEVKRLGELLVDRDQYIANLRCDLHREAKGFVRGLERAKDIAKTDGCNHSGCERGFHAMRCPIGIADAIAAEIAKP